MSELLTDSECKKVLLAFANGHAGGVTIEHSQCVLEWAHQTKTNAILLDLVIDGKVQIDWVDDGIVFKPVIE